MKVNCLIIDDEPWALDLMEDFIQKVPYLYLVGRSEGPVSAFPYFENDDIDLIFLDIRMPDLSGTQFLKTLNKRPAVIFVTAHNEFAVEGFELDAVDYLLKPIRQERLDAAIEKLKSFGKTTEPSSIKKLEGSFCSRLLKVLSVRYFLPSTVNKATYLSSASKWEICS